MDGVQTLQKNSGIQNIDMGAVRVRRKFVYRFLKRVMDITISGAALVLLSPVFLITACAIVLEDGGPVIYTQERVGKNKNVFKIYKFRSMSIDAEIIHEELRRQYHNTEISFKLKEDPRITKFGKIIRKYNIDELPQLINILKGEMSFVGPRPLPTYEYIDEQNMYGDENMLRYTVPQGLTCYWQISNRSQQTFEERMEMDVMYARQCSIKEDAKIFMKTFLFTITGKAAY